MASIAKLAIQVTTDTTKMSAGLRNAQIKIRDFESGVSLSRSSLDSLGASMFRGNVAASALRFGLQKTWQFLKHAAEAAADLQDRLDAVNGTKGGTESLHTQYKRLWDTIAVVGLPVVKRLAGALDNLLGAFEAANRREGFSVNADKFIADLERQEKAMEEAKKAAEEMAKADKEATEERMRNFEKMKDRAKGISESLRTPLEIMKDEQRELNDLFNRAMLSRNELERGLKRTADEYRKATDRANEFKSATRIGAAEQGSQQAASVIAAARNAAGSPVQIDPQLLVVLQKQLMVQQAALRKDPVQIKSGAF